MIVLDFGSGNTCKNNTDYVKRMIDELSVADSGLSDIVIKWQLFKSETVPYCLRLDPDVFEFAYRYSAQAGYKTTASVFDMWSLRFLSQFDIPFIKLACRDWVYPLIATCSLFGVKAVVSVPCVDTLDHIKQQWPNVSFMCCVPKYPAQASDYRATFGESLRLGISDHSFDFRLYHEYEPLIYERHYKLEDSTGPDADVFASTPAALKEIL